LIRLLATKEALKGILHQLFGGFNFLPGGTGGGKLLHDLLFELLPQIFPCLLLERFRIKNEAGALQRSDQFQRNPCPTLFIAEITGNLSFFIQLGAELGGESRGQIEIQSAIETDRPGRTQLQILPAHLAVEVELPLANLIISGTVFERKVLKFIETEEFGEALGQWGGGQATVDEGKITFGSELLA